MRRTVAILDDYPGAALRVADWSGVRSEADITVFDRHLSEEEAARELAPFDVICTMRERTAFPRTLIERLPRLRLLTIVGTGLPNLDLRAATEHGVLVSHSDFTAPRFRRPGMSDATPELAWALLMATVRNLAAEDRNIRAGGWQTPGAVGTTLSGGTLGLLGLGTIGRRMAAYAQVFGMDVLAWSEHLTAGAAAEAGARLVGKAELLARADVVSVHLVLSERTRGLLGAADLASMKPTAYLINTSRGPIVDEQALVAALREQRIAGAGLDVFDTEPLPPDHPLRTLPNVTLTPHIGYSTHDLLAAFYEDTAELVTAWLAGNPIRVLTHQQA
ncbi:D-2-hydroxyacid dehydrogenase family protein [Actinoplanes sp. RD1]|uniref:D-2-hydroxyacid dehydrogenase family protein n=1 Tax=Actinoplanes sp. RD1 TaxID=3064538 RepID=UPI0027409991|nr:D-2-hydroxyacid dehydrogenase family protein [Actinoplanes sp. RD1]